MIRRAMLSSGTAGLYFLPPNTTMNGPRYVEMLGQKLDLHIAESRVFILEAFRLTLFKRIRQK